MAYLKRNSSILSILGILFFLAGLLWNACNHGGDFKVFYLAGERFLTHQSVYNPADGWSPFKYHPAWAVVFSLWSLLPFTLATLAFNAVNMGLWIWAAHSWSKLLNYKITTTSFLILVVLSLNAMSAETAYGQINGLLFWGATQIFLWLEDSTQKPFRSGLLLAVLISLKLNLGILLFYALYKNWRTALGLLGGALVLHGIVSLSFGDIVNWGLYHSWLDLLMTQSKEQFNTFEVQSVLRVCYVLFGESLAKTIWAGLLGLAVVLGIYLDRTHKHENPQQRTALAGGYWLAIIFFFSPLAWWYQVLYLFPLAFLLLKNSTLPKAQWLARICLCSFAFISFNTIGRAGIFSYKFYMGYFAAGMILWLYFLWDRVRPAQAQISLSAEKAA
ncbi:MAG: DUF2029 domain-containing protein [Bdellovibrionales bacterium]|nr:DUF2029 domain-containing protein [Bdellovibrionales bacterium]